MNKIIVAAILTSGFVFNVFARTEQEIKKDVYKTSSNIVSTYQNSGMSGIEASSQECWEKIEKQEFQCLYIDMAARYIDRLGGGGNTFPLNVYFDDEQFGTRTLSFFNKKGISMENANMYLANMQPIVNEAINRALKLSESQAQQPAPDEQQTADTPVATNEPPFKFTMEGIKNGWKWYSITSEMDRLTINKFTVNRNAKNCESILWANANGAIADPEVSKKAPILGFGEAAIYLVSNSCSVIEISVKANYKEWIYTER